MACASCRQTRRKLADEIMAGNYAAAVKTAKHGARQIASKVIARPPPPVIRRLPRR